MLHALRFSMFCYLHANHGTGDDDDSVYALHAMVCSGWVSAVLARFLLILPFNVWGFNVRRMQLSDMRSLLERDLIRLVLHPLITPTTDGDHTSAIEMWRRRTQKRTAEMIKRREVSVRDLCSVHGDAKREYWSKSCRVFHKVVQLHV